MGNVLRNHAKQIWQAAVDAVRPEVLIPAQLADLAGELRGAPRILILGGGKAGATMADAVETALADQLDCIQGLVNVPADSARLLKKIRLHAARPAGTNFPTPDGVIGAIQVLDLARSAGPDDVALCLISGGGSALLPAPADGIALDGNIAVTQMLVRCGATINELNAVRKHLSAIKGGRLAQAFAGKALYSLILSDVIDDPLDVIASGPTVADPATFADALAVLARYSLQDKVPAGILQHLKNGADGQIAETLKSTPACVHNRIIGNNATA